MLEQEIASIIKFTLDATGNPAPYYNEVKEDFVVPSVYFPSPEIDSDGETFSTYRLRYKWFIKFFHKTTEAAYDLAFKALIALKEKRNCVPLIDTKGGATGDSLRLADPAIKKLDSGAYQLALEWDSRRPYYTQDYTASQRYSLNMWNKADVYLERVVSDKTLEEIRRLAELHEE